jgi:hypothetical protein
MIERCKLPHKGSCWVLRSKRTGKILGHHKSRAAAERQERAINLSKARRAGHRIPKRPAKRRRR